MFRDQGRESPPLFTFALPSNTNIFPPSPLQVHLVPGNYFGVSAASADSPDSFELFKFAISSPEVGHTVIHNEKVSGQVDHDGHTIGKHPDHVKNSQQEVVGGGKREQKTEPHGKLPHERDFGEWKEEVPDKPASIYKTQEEQFKDLHDRLTSLVCFPPNPPKSISSVECVKSK